MKAILCTTQPLQVTSFEKISDDRVLSGTPSSAHHVFYTSASEEFTSGLYECTVGKWRISYTEDEFCTLITGAVILESNSGERQEFTAPASFIIPSGYKGTWESLTPVRKFFVIYEKTK